MGGGGKAPTATTTTTQQFAPIEQAHRNQVQDEAARIYEATKGSVATSQYPGAKPVGPSEATQTSLAAGQQAAAAGGAYAGEAMNASKYGFADAMNVDNNKYLQGAIKAAYRPLDEAAFGAGGDFSQLRSGFSDQYGGTRQGIAEGIAMSRLQATKGDIAAKMSSAAYDKGQDTYARTLALAPGIQQMGGFAPAMYGAVGQTQEGYQQEGENYAAAARGWDLNKEWAPLQNWANIVYGGATPGTSTTQTGSLPGSNKVVSGLSGALSGGAMGAMIAGASAGSIAPGVGTAIGAGMGLLAGIFAK